MNVMRLNNSRHRGNEVYTNMPEVCLLQRLLKFIMQRINPLFVSPFDISRLLIELLWAREREKIRHPLKLQNPVTNIAVID